MQRNKWSKRKIARVFDGDSGVFANGEPFRLANVGAPEKNQFGYSKAKRTFAGMIGRSDKEVYVKKVGEDKYGRSVVEISNKDGSINKRMRKKGWKDKGR